MPNLWYNSGMGRDNEVVIVAINTQVANLEQMKEAVGRETGDSNPFFCPQVVEGKPYNGHAHTFPALALKDHNPEPIVL